MNKMFASLQNNIAKSNGVGAEAAVDNVLGPAYDYTSGIQVPKAKGVGDSGTIDQVITNANAMRDYVNQLTIGPIQGNQYFLDTGGKCVVDDENDPNNGKEVARSTWVDNRLTASDAAAIFPGLKDALGGSLDSFAGIIPGMMGDVVSTNPVTIMNSLILPGKPPCMAFECPVTDKGGSGKGVQAHYLTAGLEQAPINQKCKRVKSANPDPASPEMFTPVFGYARMDKVPLPYESTIIDKVFFASALLVFVGLIMHKV